MKGFNRTVVAFNSLIQELKFNEALGKFHSKDCVFAFNISPTIVGIDAFKIVLDEFIQHVTINELELVSMMMEKDLSVTNWYCAFDHKNLGNIDMHYMAVQRWGNNKIIQESLFYNL